jgi:PAS domain S-box-containing protein
MGAQRNALDNQTGRPMPMKTLFSCSIYESLIIIVLLATLPAMAVNFYTGIESREHAQRDANDKALNLARSLTAMQKSVTNEARVLLTTLERMPAVKNFDRQVCDQRFTSLLKDHPELSNIFLTDRNGIVVASGLPPFLGVDLSDRQYFKDVAATHAFSVGAFNIGRASGLPIQVFAIPILVGDGRFLGLLGASFKLGIYPDFLGKLQLPPEVRTGFFDRDSLRMLAYPDSAAYPLGQALPASLWEMVTTAVADEGTFSGTRQTGEASLIAYSRLRLTAGSPPYLTIMIAIPWNEAFREANALFARNMALLALAAILALVIARMVGRAAVLKGLGSLMAATGRLGAGDLTARSAVTEGSREVRQLGATFNDMAEALQTHQTELQHTTDALNKTRNLLNNILESMPSAVIGLDEHGRITHWNASAQTLCDLPRESAIGRDIADALPLLASHMSTLQTALQERTAQRLDLLAMRQGDLVRLLDIQFYPLVANGLTGVVIRLDDVTERERLREMMIQSEKMASVGGLAAGMAHEINNPLSSILQAAQICQMQIDPDVPANRQAAEDCGCPIEVVRCYLEKRRILKFLDGIREAGARAAQIVASMLEFSRKSESRRAPTDVNESLDKSVALAATDYDLKKRYDFRHIAILKDYAPDLPKVPCTRTEIEQVVLNLLKNAAQAFAGRSNDAPPPTIALRTRRLGDFVRIEVEDNGPGMTEAVRKRIFEPFFTTKEPGQGTGLGLSVCYFIITTNHGGMIRVESQPGKGSTFLIDLPLGDGA